MITRVYIDNYKCLVNFEYKPEKIQLVYGANGSGKSTFLDVISLLKEYVFNGKATTGLFHKNSITRPQVRNIQVFEMDIRGNGGLYSYRLEIEHDPSKNICRTQLETLTFDGENLFRCVLGDARLYRDNHSEGPEAKFDWGRSGIAALGQRSDNTKLQWFKHRVGKIACVRINPWSMNYAFEDEELTLDRRATNFAAWYASKVGEMPKSIHQLHETLSEIIDGFDQLTVKGDINGIKTFSLLFKSKDSAEYPIRLDELSDGQRCLIVLYTLLHCHMDDDMTLLFDEPDSFVSLPEIQPFLVELQDRVENRTNAQSLLVSHHPELINKFGRDGSVRFVRENTGPTRIKDLGTDPDSGLDDAEQIARGWENG